MGGTATEMKIKRVKEARERVWEVRGGVKESQSAQKRRKTSRRGDTKKTIIQSNNDKIKQLSRV